MTPEQQAARWLADVPRVYPQQSMIAGKPLTAAILETDALASIARHLAPSDELMAEAGALPKAFRLMGMPDTADTITVLLAQNAALRAERDQAYANGYGDAETEISATALGEQNKAIHDQLTRAKAQNAALTAQVAELEATVAEVTSDRAYIIGANAGWEAAVEQGQATPAAQEVLARAEAAEAEVSRLRARLARMEGAGDDISEAITQKALAHMADGRDEAASALKQLAEVIAPAIAALTESPADGGKDE